jgi:trehalose 6-phosphate phosphatase
VLARLGPRVGQLAVVTGRPVQAVRHLGGFEGVEGLATLVVLGQYGYERWDAATGRVVAPPPPDAVQHVRAELADVLAQHGWADAHVEEKGRALGVHLRRLRDPDAAFRALLAPLTELAEQHGLTVEPGKQVIEIRADGMDKGIALRELVEEVGARTVLFAGDDLGDVPAFDAVAAMRADGVAGLTICSHSGERTELADHTDLAVDGPVGVVRLLSELADAIGA